MNRRRFVLASAGLAGGMAGQVLSITASAASSRMGIAGKQAPELEVGWWIDADGKPTTFKLADHRGKWIFLKCFQNWCPGCHSHGFPALQRVAAAFQGDTGVAVAGIQTVFEGFHANTQGAVRKLQLRYRLRIPMGHDAGKSGGDHLPRLMRQYRTGGTPWIIIIDRSGKVAYDGFNVNAEAVIKHFRTT